jgi:hypothetical protein
MTGRTCGTRGAGTLAVAAAVAMLATACGVVHVRVGSPGPVWTESGNYQQTLAYAQCMRSHGLRDFPLPNPSETSGVTSHVIGNLTGPAARANDACKHLLSGGSTAAAG